MCIVFSTAQGDISKTNANYSVELCRILGYGHGKNLSGSDREKSTVLFLLQQ
jgi:hypothetical protein